MARMGSSGSSAAAATPKWDAITDPTGNLSLAMAAYTTTYTWNAATGASNLFTLTDTLNNTGTGYLLNVITASGSTVKPLRVAAVGTDALVVDASGNTTIGGLLKTGTTPTTLTDAAGKILSASLNTVGVAQGGTGNTTFTAYAVICAGITATGAFQNVVGLGSSGQVLTSAGAGALPAWATPTTGTVTSVAMTVPTFLSIAGSPITTSGTLAVTLSGTALPVANGGTGQTTYTDGQLLIGNTTGNTLAKATLTGTANQVVVTNGSGTITLSTPQSIATTSTPQFARMGLGAAADSIDILTIAGGTASADDRNLISSTITWNNAGNAFVGFYMNITDTASSSSSGFIDCLISGVSKFSVDKTGKPTFNTPVPIVSGGTNYSTPFNANAVVYYDSASMVGTSSPSAYSILVANAGAPDYSQAPIINTSVQIGVASSVTGSLILGHASSANLTTFKSGNATAAVTYTLPTADGTSGKVLSTNGSGVLSWVSLGGRLDQITAATGTNTIDSTNNAQVWNWSTLSTQIGFTSNFNAISSGTGFSFASTSTAGTGSGSSFLVDISRSGTNANATHAAYGIRSQVTNTGTTSTNVACYLSASGATNNYGLIVNAGRVGIGTTTPAQALDVNGTVKALILTSGSAAGAAYALDVQDSKNADVAAYILNTHTSGYGTVIAAAANSTTLYSLEVRGNTSTVLLSIYSIGNIVCGNAALATSATDGFLYIPTCAGTPTGVPTTYSGRVPIVFDTSNTKLYVYAGGSWKGGTVPGAFV